MPTNPGLYTGRAWRRFRELVIVKSNGQCSRCGQIFTDTSKLEVHHIDYLKGNDYNDPTKVFNENNVEVICHTCHNKEHDRFANYKEVMLVYGPPLSGKTSFVLENKYNNDLVVDLDSLQEAITGLPRYVDSNAVKYNLFRVRDLLLDQIKTRYGNWKRAWIIGGYANTFDRERLIKECNIDVVIYMDASRDECIKRLNNAADQRNALKDQWTEFIDAWFEQYTPH